MPYYYYDSTALVKRYSMERGTRIVNSASSTAPTIEAWSGKNNSALALIRVIVLALTEKTP